MRKKSRLPAVIVCILILGIASFNTWREITYKPVVELSKNPFLVMHFSQNGNEPPPGKDMSLVKIGSFDSQGVLTETLAPAHPEKDFVYPLFTFEALPENTADAIEKIAAAMKLYSRDNRKIDELYIELKTKDVDFEKLHDFTHALRLAMHQRYWINLFIKDSWLAEDQKNIVWLKNLTKSSRFFVYEGPKNGSDVSEVASVIGRHERSGTTFFLKVSALPDLATLKSRMGSLRYFAGLLLDNGETK